MNLQHALIHDSLTATMLAPKQSSEITTPHIDIRYRTVIAIALPVMFANIAVPLQSMIDTAIVGHMGHVNLVAGLGIAAQVMLLLLGSFYFLQASTSGLAAQQLGKLKTQRALPNSALIAAGEPSKDSNGTIKVLIQALVVAVFIAIIVVVFHRPIIEITLSFFGASDTVRSVAATYLYIRFWGFPAELANYAFFGWFAGLGMTRTLLIQQLLISTSNVLLSIFFVYGLSWQLDGIATATVLTHYVGLAFASIISYRTMHNLSSKAHQYQNNSTQPTQQRIVLLKNALTIDQLKPLFALNGNIFIRTVLLTLSFAWITRLATQQGELFLASNVILLYILSLSAFALDGIAVSAKTLVGQTYAAYQLNSTAKPLFIAALKHTGIINLILASFLSVMWLILFPYFISLITSDASIQGMATTFYWFACFLPLIGATAYWLDGVFFGLTDGTVIRNAMIIVAVIFFPCSILFTTGLGNTGVWLSIYVLLLLRAMVLGVFLVQRQ